MYRVPQRNGTSEESFLQHRYYVHGQMLPIASLSMRLAKTQNWIQEFARRQIAIITDQAWLSESKDLEDKVAKMSIRTGVRSKYSNMISAQTNKAKQASKSVPKQKQAAQLLLLHVLHTGLFTAE